MYGPDGVYADFPFNAATSTESWRIVRVEPDPAGSPVTGPTYGFVPSGLAFRKAVTITIPYDETLLQGPEADIQLWYDRRGDDEWKENGWRGLDGYSLARVDEADNTFHAKIHLAPDRFGLDDGSSFQRCLPCMIGYDCCLGVPLRICAEDEPVRIPDPNLYRYVWHAMDDADIDVPTFGDDFTYGQVMQVTDLPLANTNGTIKDLSGLQCFKNLERLDLSAHDVENLVPLAHLTHLEELDLSSNEVDDLLPLAFTPGLKTLILSWNRLHHVNSLRGLERISNLETLFLDHNGIGVSSYLGAVANHGGLTILSLNSNHIRSVEFLADLDFQPTLVLALAGNEIADLWPLVGALVNPETGSHIAYLDLRGTQEFCANEDGMQFVALDHLRTLTDDLDDGCADCGNGVLDDYEQCDSGDFGLQSCLTLTPNDGELECTERCKIRTRNCNDPCPAITRESRFRAVHNSGDTNDGSQFLRGATSAADIDPGYADYLHGLNVDWVGIGVSLFVESWLDPVVEREYRTGPPNQGGHFTWNDDELKAIIRYLRDHDFHVYISLGINQSSKPVAENMRVDRTMLGQPDLPGTYWSEETFPWNPGFEGIPGYPDRDTFVAEFWRGYTEEARRIASLAWSGSEPGEAAEWGPGEGACMFAVGVELTGLYDKRLFEDEIGTLIAGVRGEFGGHVTYNMHYSVILENNRAYYAPHKKIELFEDHFDVVGLSSYFPLVQYTDDVERRFERHPVTLPLEQLYPTSTWEEAFRNIFEKEIRAGIIDKQHDRKLPVLLTELGYVDSLQAPILPCFLEYSNRTPCNPPYEVCPSCRARDEEPCLEIEKCNGGGGPNFPYGPDNDSDGNNVADDLDSQERIYQAFFNTMNQDDLADIIQGAFLWDMPVAGYEQWEGAETADDRRFTVRGKPAEDVVRAEYCKLAGRIWNEATGECEPAAP